MSEQLDNELKKRISEVFDNYEDTTPAEEGWLLLRQKFPEKKKNRVIPMWWMATAAVFLLLCVVGVWFYNQQTTPKQGQFAVKPQTKPAKPAEQNSQQTPIGAVPNNDRAAATNTPEAQWSAAERMAAQTGTTGKPAYRANTAPSLPPNNTNGQNNLLASVFAPATTASGLPAQITKNSGVTAALSPASTNISGTDSIKTDAQAAILAQQNPVQNRQQKSIISTQKDSAVTGASQSRMAAFLANEQKKEEFNTKKDKTDNKLNADKRVLYGIYAATYFNYAEGSKSQVNTGAGFSTDIRLSKNFKLSTGIAIGKNTLSYENQPVSASMQNDAIAASNNAKVEMIPAYASNAQLGFVPLKVATSPVVSAYNISLTGLDVPINIKYEFNPQKSDAYISAGFSSGTFISESFNYRFNNNVADGIATSSFTNNIPDASTSKSFTGFNFARTLNLSMGIGYQLTRQNRLVIEPFFKYPLGGLGSQQIRFGSGGINLQFKFQGGAKK